MKNTFVTLVSIFFVTLNLTAQTSYFPPIDGSTWDTIDADRVGYCQEKIDSLYAFLEDENSKAFILLKDGRIVLERYFHGHEATSLWQWASAGKTITAFMVGIAQQEGLLTIHDTTSQYLGSGWTSCLPSQENLITIKHQLSMTSGLDDAVVDPYCTLDSCLIYISDAGTRWAYHNGPYTLLDEVIAEATNQSMNEFTTQKLKNPIGMSGLFVPVGYNHVFFSTARSMARFGLLILNKGYWNGQQIMTDTNYFQEMTQPSQQLNQSYGYLWWLNGQPSFMLPGSQLVFHRTLIPNAPPDLISAMGKGGQFLNVVPSENLVWLRMGESPDGVAVPYLLNDKIWNYIHDLSCTPSDVSEVEVESSKLYIFPNPFQKHLTIQCQNRIESLFIYNTKGELMDSCQSQSKDLQLDTSTWPSDIYLLNIELTDGSISTKKIIKY